MTTLRILTSVAAFFVLAAFKFDPATVRPRVFTPNGDAKNDRVFFIYENPDNVSVKVTIFDSMGAEVKEVTAPGPVASLSRIWDGTDEGGNPAPAGIYVFRLEAADQVFVGTVVLAR